MQKRRVTIYSDAGHLPSRLQRRVLKNMHNAVHQRISPIILSAVVTLCTLPAAAETNKTHIQVHRTGYYAKDAYTVYLEMGSPKKLTSVQIKHLNGLTKDIPETDKVVRSGPAGTVEYTFPINSNDTVLVTL